MEEGRQEGLKERMIRGKNQRRKEGRREGRNGERIIKRNDYGRKK